MLLLNLYSKRVQKLSARSSFLWTHDKVKVIIKIKRCSKKTPFSYPEGLPLDKEDSTSGEFDSLIIIHHIRLRDKAQRVREPSRTAPVVRHPHSHPYSRRRGLQQRCHTLRCTVCHMH